MKNKNSKINSKKPKNKINTKHNIKPKIKLNKIKKILIEDRIISINFFKNLNFLVLTLNKYRIYSPKFELIKAYDLKYEIQEIKIIDNENFKCLYNYDQYVNMNIKNNKIKKIINFGRSDITSIKYYKKNIIAISDINTIFIWEFIEKNKYQFTTKIKLGIYCENIFVFEQYDIFISCGFDNLGIYNLKKNKIDSISKELSFRAAMPFYGNNILFLGGNDDWGYKYLTVYNIKEKKIIKNMKFDFFFNVEEANTPDLIKYYQKKDVIIICGGNNNVFNNVYIYDRDFNLIQTLEKIHYRNIVGLTIYERSTNDLILSYTKDGEISFYSIN